MTRAIINLGGTASDVVVGKVGVSSHSFCSFFAMIFFITPIARPHDDDVRRATATSPLD